MSSPLSLLARGAARWPVCVAPLDAVESLAPDDFRDALVTAVTAGARNLLYYGRPDGDAVVLTAALQGEAGLHLLRCRASRERPPLSLTRDLPRFHAHEREIHEQTGLQFREHPWLKPIRFEGHPAGALDDYPWYTIAGKEVHEVQVGPIHAGVIEPGAFRFMCHGERVYHLEIHLGFQHRGAEALLRSRPLPALAPLVETIAGDSSVAYAWGHAEAVEALAGVEVDLPVRASRGVGLELERIAMHLASLSGLLNDIGFLQGSSTYGRLRTAAINASMRVCGSRFGRTWVRPGGVRSPITPALVDDLRRTLAALARDTAECNALTTAAKTVQHRFRGAGVVTTAQAAEVGLMGMHARTCGLSQDLRADLPGQLYRKYPVPVVTEQSGDCWARMMLRIRELDASLAWLDAVLQGEGPMPGTLVPIGPLRRDHIAIAAVEGWRGPVVHAIETDAAGAIVHYKLQDPSLYNWLGLGLAVRDNEISDFPICNKSFDLSYCGNDL